MAESFFGPVDSSGNRRRLEDSDENQFVDLLSMIPAFYAYM